MTANGACSPSRKRTAHSLRRVAHSSTPSDSPKNPSLELPKKQAAPSPNHSHAPASKGLPPQNTPACRHGASCQSQPTSSAKPRLPCAEKNVDCSMPSDTGRSSTSSPARTPRDSPELASQCYRRRYLTSAPPNNNQSHPAHHPTTRPHDSPAAKSQTLAARTRPGVSAHHQHATTDA